MSLHLDTSSLDLPPSSLASTSTHSTQLPQSKPSTTRPFSTPATRWAALTSRNPHSDTHFIYGVLTTKIYCRPICPSRLARRANVTFFDTPAQAAAAGFRLCKRCKPETQATFRSVDSEGRRRREGVEKAVKLMEERGGKGISLEEAARVAGVGGKWHFLRVFKEVRGETPGGLMARLRRGERTDEGGRVGRTAEVGTNPGLEQELGSARSSPRQGPLSPLEAAWMTTDLSALERLFDDMFPGDSPPLDDGLLDVEMDLAMMPEEAIKELPGQMPLTNTGETSQTEYFDFDNGQEPVWTAQDEISWAPDNAA